MRRFLEYFYVVLLLFVVFILLINSVLRESPVYDEPIHLQSGYEFLTKHDFRIEPFNPPLAREIAALPLLLNKSLANDPVLLWPRLMVIFFTLALGFIIYYFTKKNFGIKSGVFALFLFSFEPNILAHGHYVNTDLIATFFIFLSIMLFITWRNRFNISRLIVIAVILGFSFSTKLSAVLFICSSIALIYLITKKDIKNSLENKKNKIKQLLLVFFVVSLTLWSTYFFTFEPLLGYRFDPNRQAAGMARNNPLINFALNQPVPLGSFISTIKQDFVYNYSPLYSRKSYLNGQISNNGFILYFPEAFLLKTQIGLMLLFVFSLVFYCRDRARRNLLVPIGLIFLVLCFSKVDLGIRYLLPLYPFLIVFSAQIINHKILRNKSVLLLFLAILIFYPFSLLKSYPHYISYFNEIISPGTGHKYLIDSNYDWGQGLPDLRTYQKNNNIKNLQLGYFGAVNPQDYGVEYERIKDLSSAEKQKTVRLDTKKTLAISITCWYLCGYYNSPQLSELKIKDIVGGSIFILSR